ncbi:MAG: DUF445 family protein [Clostridiales bacterium]|jgi:hypothetical protein|nr:DUF445 family protein [Clostridiales bacterium]
MLLSARNAIKGIDVSGLARGFGMGGGRVMPGGLSEAAASTLSDNFDKLLQGNVKKAVIGKLGGFSDEKLLGVAESFFGQFRHIAVSGAFIGGLVGLLSGAALPAPFPVASAAASGAARDAAGGILSGAISMAASAIVTALSPSAAQGAPDEAARALAVGLAAFANAAVFALIGWMTNIVAIRMLFRPYRDVSVLGLKIRSVISVNKAKLAVAVGKFIDESLMEPDSLARHMLARDSRSIESFVRRAFGQNGRGAIARAVRQNKQKLADWLASRAEREFTGKVALIADAAVTGIIGAMRRPARASGGDRAGAAAESEAGMASGQAAGAAAECNSAAPTAPSAPAAHAGPAAPSAPAAHAAQAAGAEAGSAAPRQPAQWNSRELIEKALLALANADTALIPLIFGDEPGGSAALGKIEAAVGRRLLNLDDIEIRSLIRKLASAGYEKFAGSGAGLGILCSGDALEAVLSSVLASERVQRRISRIIAEYFGGAEPKRASPDILAGWAEKALASGGEAGAAWIRGKLKEAMLSGEQAIKSAVGEGVESGSGFLASVAWRAAHGEEVLDGALSHFIKNQAPLFVDSHASEIDALAQRLARLLIDLLRRHRPFAVNGGAVAALACGMMSNPAVSTALCGSAARVTGAAFGGMGAKELLEPLGCETREKFLARGDFAIRAISEALAQNVRIESEGLAKAASSLLGELLLRAKGRYAISDVFSASGPELSLLAQSLDEAFFQNRGGMDAIADSFARSVEKNRAGAENLIGRILSKPETAAELRLAVRTVSVRALGSAADDVGVLLSDGLADGAIALAVRVGVGALAEAMPEIIRTLDLKTVAENEINAMDARKIESVFYSFAGRYIRRIKLYGLWGGVFGLHFSVSALSALFAAIANLAARARRRRPRG